jgi:stage II sporulation protein AB (anti-sigma F factor)
MNVAPSTLSEAYPAVPDSIPVARRALTTFAIDAGLSSARTDELRLAASEALTNVVLHGYGEETGQIHVSASVVGPELWILVSDDGNGLRVRTDRPGLGLGLALIAQASDEFTLVPGAAGGTELRMCFCLPPTPRAVDRRCHGVRRPLHGSIFSAHS